MSQQKEQRRLILHFDVNNTIVLKDSAMNLTVEDNVCKLVAQTAWGVMTTNQDEDAEPYVWTATHNQLSYDEPAVPSNPPDLEEGESYRFVTYWDFMKKAYPEMVDEVTGDKDHMREAIRKELLSSFVNKDSPGESFMKEHKKLL